MRFLNKLCVLFAYVTLFIASHLAYALEAISPLSSPVTDLTQTLSLDQQAALAQKLSAFAKEKGSQIAVLIVPTTQPEDIAQYSIRVAEAWKIGRDKQDDGVIVLVAKNDRKMRIEVGYGLEGAIPDLIAKRIVSEQMSPHFKQGDFIGGLNQATDTLMQLINGEHLAPPEQVKQNHSKQDFSTLFPLFMFGAIIFGAILKSVFGTVFGSAVNGGVLGGLAWVLGAGLMWAGLAGLAAFVFTLAMGGRGGSGYPIGYGGGYGGGNSGGDVFSGGGGDFGGGGASGDW